MINKIIAELSKQDNYEIYYAGEDLYEVRDVDWFLHRCEEIDLEQLEIFLACIHGRNSFYYWLDDDYMLGIKFWS